jgi:hypothetical protein
LVSDGGVAQAKALLFRDLFTREREAGVRHHNHYNLAAAGES